MKAVIAFFIIFFMNTCSFAGVRFFHNGKAIEQNSLPYSVEDQTFTLESSLRMKKAHETIKKVFSVKDDEARKILAKIHGKTAALPWPKTEDVLAIIATESSFRSDAKTQTSYGLMQVNGKVWGNNHKDVEKNIEKGIDILHSYWKSLDKDVKKTVVAYNIGITDVKKGKWNADYLNKFHKHRKMFR